LILPKTLEKTGVAIKKRQYRDPGNIGYTRHRTKSNKAKNTTQNSGNQEKTIQKPWQHWVHQTQDEVKQSKKHNTEQWQSRKDNTETLATLGTPDTGRSQTKQKTQHRKLKNMSNKDPIKPKGGRGWI
jgi:hypothetical protein